MTSRKLSGVPRESPSQRQQQTRSLRASQGDEQQRMRRLKLLGLQRAKQTTGRMMPADFSCSKSSFSCRDWSCPLTTSSRRASKGGHPAQLQASLSFTVYKTVKALVSQHFIVHIDPQRQLIHWHGEQPHVEAAACASTHAPAQPVITPSRNLYQHHDAEVVHAHRLTCCCACRWVCAEVCAELHIPPTEEELVQQLAKPDTRRALQVGQALQQDTPQQVALQASSSTVSSPP